MPLLWFHLALVRQFARVVQRLFVDDVQHDLGVYVTACRTRTSLSISVICSFLKVSYSIYRVAVEHGVATLVQEPQTVEQLVDITRRLVDVHHDELALQRLLFQQVDHLLRVSRRQARCRLVEEQHGRFSDQLQRDVQSLALSTADVFVDGRSHLQVLGSVQSQVFKGLHDALVKLLVVHALEAELGGEPKVLVYRQLLNQQVVLWHEAYQALRLGFVNAVSVNGDGALLRLQTAVEQRE